MKKRGEIRANASSLLGRLWPAIRAEQASLIRKAATNATDSGEAESQPAGLPQQYRRLACDWRLPAPPEQVRVNPSGAMDDRNEIEFNWAGEDARHTGILVHRLLHLVANRGLENWNSDDDLPKAVNWCFQQLAIQGILNGRAQDIIARVTRAIETCLGSERGRWLLRSHADAHCELAISVVMGAAEPADTSITRMGQQRVNNLVLDRTFIDQGYRWIVDYKTSSHAGGDLEGFIENESGRYRLQLRRYRDAMALVESLPIRTALYFPLHDRFLEVE